MLLALPIIIPLATAVLALVVFRHRTLQRAIAILGTVALLGASVWILLATRDGTIHAVQVGNWPAPFGITLVADLLTSIMLTISAVIALVSVVYSIASVGPERESFGYYSLFHLLLMGVCGAFMTGDIFNMFVWFEVMLICSFVLLSLGGERQQMEGAVKYVAINLISSGILLAAVGIIYGLTGTLNMADLARKLPQIENRALVTAAAMLFLIPFGIKAAVFPLFFWLPASYHTPPVAVSALFAGLLTKVGVYALIRVFTLLFIGDAQYTHVLILVISALTMTIGVLGAVAQNEFRRILSFHIISQIGYMTMGLGFLTSFALGAAIFFTVHNIIVKTNLFLVAGIAKRLLGTEHLKKSGGLYRSHPMLGVLFLIPALSIAGIPPLSGFFGKLYLIQAGLEIQQYVMIAVAAVVSMLTLFSMTKIWTQVFWEPTPDQAPKTPPAMQMPESVAYYAPTITLAVLTVGMGLFAGPVAELMLRAGEQLMDPQRYIMAVFGEMPQ